MTSSPAKAQVDKTIRRVAKSDYSGPILDDFRTAVAQCQARGLLQIEFWWRDDDLIANSTALQRLSTLTERLAINPLIAIIPGYASPRLSDTLGEASGHLWFAQHGFVHANHEQEGRPPSEFCGDRVDRAGIRDIAEGRAIMLSLRLSRFLDIFVPPWNRLDPAFLSLLPRLGFTGISGYEGHSAYTPEDANHVGLKANHVNVEVTRWGKTPEMFSIDEVLVRITKLLRNVPSPDSTVSAALTGRLRNRGEIGILTHHRVMRDHEFEALEDLFTMIGQTTGCSWIGPHDAFA